MKESFTCQRGALTIRGHVRREREGALPPVILCHGFTADETTLEVYADELAKQGFAAFSFDFCGGGIHTKSDGKTTDMTLFTELEDLRAVMDYVRTRTDVDYGLLTLLGCSQGGAVCAMTAKKYPGEVHKLVLFYPALCIPDDARAGRMLFAKFDPKNVPEVICRFPMKLGGGYARCVMDMDIFEHIGGYEGPVMLIHGTKDKIVNISYADRAAGLYPNCVYYVVEKGTHGFKRKYDREAVGALRMFMAIGQRNI